MEKNNDDAPNTMTIEVAYARPDEQCILTCEVEKGCIIETAIKKSGILQRFPEINLKWQPVGIFGQRRGLMDAIQEGDRIEIYRPLLLSPMEARKKRAQSQRRAKQCSE